MATSYGRLSGWWGEIEAYRTDEELYTPAQRKPLGDNAVDGVGIGVRRAQLVFERIGLTPPQDVAVTHLDFLNVTGGEPDDTWTAGDFTTLDTIIDSLWTAIKSLGHATTRFHQIRWYRVGPAIGKPNPPVKITEYNAVATGTGDMMPPQVAVTSTYRTGVRKEWGRSYWPLNQVNLLDSGKGRIQPAIVDVLAAAIDTMVTASAAADFVHGVYGPTRGKFYSTESIQVDDVFDIIRRRRWDQPNYRKRIPPGG